MAVDHDRARVLQARGDRLRELLDNPPNINRLHREFCIDLAEYGPGMWTEFAAAFDWIDSVVAAHKAAEQ